MPPKRNNNKKKCKKAPQAPLRFKSAYIFFSIAKQKEIRAFMLRVAEKDDSNKKKVATTTIAKMVAEAWKSISPEQKSFWEEMAKQDRERFEQEKQNYTGPWKVLVADKKNQPNAPKRPMSAYLDFSNSRRAELRKQYPEATNGQISKMLAKVWKEAPVEVKREYIEREAMLRQQYKINIAVWKAEANQGHTTKPTLLEENNDMVTEDSDNLEPRDIASRYNHPEYDEDDDDRKPAPASNVDQSVNQNWCNEAARMIFGHTGRGEASAGASSGQHHAMRRLTDVARIRGCSQEGDDEGCNLSRLSSLLVNNVYATMSSSQLNYSRLMGGDGGRGGGGSYISSTSSSADEVTGLASLLSTSNDYATTTTSSNHPNYLTRRGGGGSGRVSFISSTSSSAGGGEVQGGLEPLISTDVGGFLAAAAALDSAALRQDDPCCSTREENDDISARVQGVVAQLPTEMITSNGTSTDESC